MESHKLVFSLLDDYLDDCLSPAAVAEVKHHLENCTECRKELDEKTRLLEMASSLSREISPDRDLWGDIAERISASTPLATKPRVSSDDEHLSLHRFQRGLMTFALTACAVLTIVYVGYLRPHERTPHTSNTSALVAAEETATIIPSQLTSLQILDIAHCQTDAELDQYHFLLESDRGRQILKFLDKDFKTVNQALATSRNACEDNPESPFLLKKIAAARQARFALQKLAIQLLVDEVSTQT